MNVSVVIPCYNEEDVLPESYRRFTQVMSSTSYEYELLFVNDGSKDRTESLLLSFAEQDKHVKVLSFSRNFGHQNAVTAGLQHCSGDITVIIDSGSARSSRSNSSNDRNISERKKQRRVRRT